MVELLVSWVQKSNNDVFGLPIGGKTINNYRKNIVAPFNIQKSKVHVVVKHSTKTNCTYYVKFLFTNVRRASLMKTFLDGKHILGHNQRINPWNQTNLIVSDKKPLITNDIISSKNLLWVSWSFKNGFEEEKKLEIKFGVTFCHLIVSSQLRRLKCKNVVPL